MKNARGYTLVELLVTVGIVALLAGIAYPAFLTQVRKGHRADALTTVNAISSSLERCYAAAYSYAGCANVTSGTSASLGGYYSVTVATAATTYSVTAVPTGSQALDTTCASIVLSNTGQSATDSGGTDQTSTCWGSR